MVVSSWGHAMQGDEDGEMTSEIERKFEVTAEKAHEILRRMSDEDCEALGFNVKFSRPDWMILTVLPVPPPPVRPSVMMDSAARYVRPLVCVASVRVFSSDVSMAVQQQGRSCAPL